LGADQGILEVVARLLEEGKSDRYADDRVATRTAIAAIMSSESELGGARAPFEIPAILLGGRAETGLDRHGRQRLFVVRALQGVPEFGRDHSGAV